MTLSSQSWANRLLTAIDLAQTVDSHGQAHFAFQELLADVQGQNPMIAALLERLWQEYLSSQQALLFWEQLSTVEKHLSVQLTERHLKLNQNYLRLIQEQ